MEKENIIKQKMPHIGFEYADSIDPLFLDDFRKKVYSNSIVTVEEKRPGNPVYMTVEWFIPTVVVLFVTKLYFETFIKEIAKDHYEILKDAIAELANKSKKNISVTLIASGEGKLGKEKIFTSAFSFIYIAQDVKTNFKFLYREGATDEQITEATSFFLDLLKEYNENIEESKLNSMLSKLTRKSSTIIICYNEITREAMILKPEAQLSLKDISSQ
jgi:hypothetical protein